MGQNTCMYKTNSLIFKGLQSNRRNTVNSQRYLTTASVNSDTGNTTSFKSVNAEPKPVHKPTSTDESEAQTSVKPFDQPASNPTVSQELLAKLPAKPKKMGSSLPVHSTYRGEWRGSGRTFTPHTFDTTISPSPAQSNDSLSSCGS